MSRGVFVTIDGPGGAGKSTLAQKTAARLTATGTPTLATAQPSTGPAGQLARHNTAIFHGHALACLVAADRYHHLESEIRPALGAGKVVICDRYVPSSHVLQALDGVEDQFIRTINAHTEPPDLAVILTCDPGELQRRLTGRGSHGRFEDEANISHTETLRYREIAAMLTGDGINTLVIDSTTRDADFLARQLTDTIWALLSRQHH